MRYDVISYSIDLIIVIFPWAVAFSILQSPVATRARTEVAHARPVLEPVRAPAVEVPFGPGSTWCRYAIPRQVGTTKAVQTGIRIRNSNRAAISVFPQIVKIEEEPGSGKSREECLPGIRRAAQGISHSADLACEPEVLVEWNIDA